VPLAPKRSINCHLRRTATALNEEAETREPRRSATNFGQISPGLVQNTTDLLFRDLWLGPALALRDRSLVTVSLRGADARCLLYTVLPNAVFCSPSSRKSLKSGRNSHFWLRNRDVRSLEIALSALARLAGGLHKRLIIQ